MKKRLIVEIVCALIIFFVGYFIGDATAISRVNKAIGTKVSSNLNTKDTASKPTEIKKTEAKQTGYGQEGELDQFGFKVANVESSKEAKTPSKSLSTTSNTYVIVKLEVTNKRTAPAQVGDFKFKLLDTDKKTSYDMNSDVTIDMDSTLNCIDHQQQAISLYDDINPNLKSDFTVVFEVPNAANYNLEIASKDATMVFNLK